ncbi:uncharacterized protein LOC144108777 isoform X2 [Amblyomma americanum]
MRIHFVAVTVMLCCFTYTTANANVEAVLEQLKQLIRDFVPDQAMAQQYIDKIDSARECLAIAKDINPAIIKQFADGLIPTVTECGGKFMSIADTAEKEAKMKACFQEKADKFKSSSGMTAAEIEMFDKAGQCIQEKVKP